jgi:DNA-directed RNA polymerase specialized sigma subunit
MSFFEGLGLGRLFGSGTPSSSSVQPLTQKDVDEAVNDFIKEYNPNPTNQQIADKLGRSVEEVNVFRNPPPHSYLHNRYNDHKYHSSQVSKTPLRDLSDFKNGGKSKKNSNKHKKLSRRRKHHSKKNKKSMKCK